MKFLLEDINSDLISTISEDVINKFDVNKAGSCGEVSKYIEEKYKLKRYLTSVTGKDPVEIISIRGHYVNKLDDSHVIDFTIGQYFNYESLKDKAIQIPVIADKLGDLEEYTSEHVQYILEE